MKRVSRITAFAILTTLTILTWVGFDALQRVGRRELEVIPEQVIAPLDPSLDPGVLANIEERRGITPEETSLYRPAPRASVLTQEEATEAGVASPSAEVSP